MRFLHLADVHLDTPFAGRSAELRERLRAASREAFRRAVDLALDQDVDAVLLAGDLFDGERLSFATERFLLEQLARLTGARVRVIYATGNHDPGRLAGRAHTLQWPEGMTVVKGPEPVGIDIHDRDGRRVGRVTAAGHATTHETRDLAADFPPPEASVPEIGLLHAQVVGARAAGAHDPYAPTELRTLLGSGYGYWALGHVHLRQRLAADPPIWYSGNLQGRNPRESGAKGALVVEMTGAGAPEVEFHPLAPVRWERLAVAGLSDARTLDALARAVEGRWREERRGDPGLPGTEWMLRIELSGPSPLHGELGRREDRRTLEDELATRLGVLEAEVRAEGVHPPVDPDAHLERQDVLGETLRMLREARASGEVLDDVRPEELAGPDPDDDEEAYLRSLLEGLDGELASRMLDREDGDGGP